jgi:hypothetical protein
MSKTNSSLEEDGMYLLRKVGEGTSRFDYFGDERLGMVLSWWRCRFVGLSAMRF